jgi:hypothetical protein
MKNIFQKLTLIFSSGCFGGLINTLTVWIFGAIGITAAFDVKIAPNLTAAYLYPRIVWGGIWSILFLLPFLQRSYVLRGLLYSLGPTIVQLFIVFPIQARKGVMGIDLGVMTPVFVLFFNALWGVSAALWLKLAQKE